MNTDDTVAVDTAMADTVLAWSADDDVDEPVRASWRIVWARATAVLAGCLVAAVLVVLAWRELPASQGAEDAPAPRAETVAAAQADVPSTAPTVAPSPLPPTTGSVAQKMTTPPSPKPVDPDTIYLQLMSDAGVKAPTNAKAIANGHLICQRLDQGHTVQAVIAEVARVNPSLDPARSKGVVYAAIDAYCPQHEDRGEY